MSDDESFNPYQAPANQEPQEVTLGDDAEFLISAREILCRETVHLPKVCIYTGEVEDLVERKKTFRSGPGWLIVPIGLSLFAAFSFVSTGLGGGITVMVFLTLLWISERPFVRKLNIPGIIYVDTTWYVNEKYLHRCQRQQWVLRGVFAFVGFIVGFTMGYESSTWSSIQFLRGLLFGAVVGGVCGAISLALRLERTLRYAGKRWRGPHKGLHALTGHTQKFTETVERMIHDGF